MNMESQQAQIFLENLELLHKIHTNKIKVKDLFKKLKTVWSQLVQRGKFTFNQKVSWNSWYLLDRPRKDTRVSQPWIIEFSSEIAPIENEILDPCFIKKLALVDVRDKK